MAVIHINGKRYEVEGGQNLLQTCLSLGLDVPYFCYHPALGSAGSCRQCAVKEYQNQEDAEAGKGRLVMSCMVETKDDMYISVDDSEAKAFREAMIELIMTNHPHDCPTCEEGGHCQLQDMTYMSGHKNRKYRFTKRTHNNQYLGPFITHEANRCIACYRCVRFYQNYAGGTDLGVFASASRVFFGRSESGVLESEFAGNLTEVCPTGVFTDKSHSERYNRKWDMQYSPSICQGCAVGCNISAGERYGELRRIENRYNGSINGYFLCDRGRFGYGYVNQKNRPTQPLVQHQVDSAEHALQHTKSLLKDKKVLGIGSTTASLESNYALKKLVGAENFCAGVSDTTLALTKKAFSLQQTARHIPSPAEIEQADAILILGEDVTQTAARIALSIRQASKNAGKKHAAALHTKEFFDEPVRRIAQDELSPIYIASVEETKLHDIAQNAIVSDVDGIVDFAQAVLLALNNQLPSIDPHGIFALAEEVANTLKNAEHPLIVSGTGVQSIQLMEKAAKIASLIDHAALTMIVPDVNSVGMAYLANKGFNSFNLDEYDAVILMENDLKYAPHEFKTKLASKSLIVVDHQHNQWIDKAEVVLPAGTFAESDGTVIAYDGKAQRYFQTYVPSYYHPETSIKDSWRWLAALNEFIVEDQLNWGTFDLLLGEMVKNESGLSGVEKIAPLATFTLHHMKIAREPNRYSGRVAMRAPISIHEPRQPQDKDSALAYSMEGYRGTDTPGSLLPFAQTPGWNSPQAWNKYLDQSGKHIKGGEGGARLTQLNVEMIDVQSETQATLNEFKLVPIYDLFASAPWREEVPIFDERNRPSLIKMTPDTASKMNIQSEDKVTVTHGDITQSYIAKIDENFADDCIGLTMQAHETLEGNFIIGKEIKS